MLHMKTATVRQVQHNLSEVLSWVEQGEEVRVLRRKQVVARLLPPEPIDRGADKRVGAGDMAGNCFGQPRLDAGAHGDFGKQRRCQHGVEQRYQCVGIGFRGCFERCDQHLLARKKLGFIGGAQGLESCKFGEKRGYGRENAGIQVGIKGKRAVVGGNAPE